MSFKRIAKPFRHKERNVEEQTLIQSPNDFPERSHNDSRERSLSPRTIDDALAEGFEITEGGWICRVEQYEKEVDDYGAIRYHHPRRHKRRGSSLVVHNSMDPQEPLIPQVNQARPANLVPQSIITHYHQLIEPQNSREKALITHENYIEIKSPLILDILREKSTYDQEKLSATKVTFHEPYQLLWHQYHALEMYLMDQSNLKDCRTHVKVLLDFLRLYSMPNVPELLELSSPNTRIQSISHASSWFLFTPGTLVVEQRSPLLDSRVFLIHSVIPPKKQTNRRGKVVYSDLGLDCQQVVYDGNVFSIELTMKSMPPFEGVISISELAFVPLHLLEGAEGMRDSLVSRGRKFWELRGRHMQETVDGSFANTSLAEKERVMVDWAMHEDLNDREYGPRDQVSLQARAGDSDVFVNSAAFTSPAERFQVRTRHRDSSENNEAFDSPLQRYLGDVTEDVTEDVTKIPKFTVSLPSKDNEPSETFLILCGCRVWAFSFRSKQWGRFHVNDLTDVDFNKKSFDRLVLREDYKMILKAMVAQHFTQGQNRFHDLVAGKGQGLNILLHGPPGVGKTLAAECIADLYERPLYSVTSGDIGTDPEVIERKLHQIFHYAVRWNAVLLLDEADVFLAERNLENLSRNALVSEYFNGVFVLTTNRVGTIDEAFQSRLHITLGLDPLSVEDRRQIWYHFIKDLKHLSKDDRRVLARHARDDWCHKDFNGRQIRNSVKTALTLARHDGEEVQARHFQIVLDIGTRFAGYMHRLKKMDRERLAEAIGTRLDLTANTLQSSETPIVAQELKRKAEDEPKRMDNREVDLDWD